MFNTIGIITKPQDITSQETARGLGTFLKEQGVSLLENEKDIEENAELIIVLGGDGSILNTARTLSESDPSRTQPLVNILVIYCLLYKKQTINCQSPRVTIVNNR